MSWVLAFTFSVVFEGSTLRVMVFPGRVFTKMCILAATPPQTADFEYFKLHLLTCPNGIVKEVGLMLSLSFGYGK